MYPGDIILLHDLDNILGQSGKSKLEYESYQVSFYLLSLHISLS